MDNDRNIPEAQRMMSSQKFQRDYEQEAYEQNRNMGYQSQYPDGGYENNYPPQYDQFRQMPQEDTFEDQNESYAGAGNNSNALIVQYESVLQSVNKEFQKLLDKNRQTEEDLSLTEMKLKQTERIIEDLKQQNMVEKINEEKRFNMTQISRSELDNEMGLLREQINRKNEEIDRLNTKVMELEHQTSTTMLLRQKVDELMNKNQIKDQSTREKEENLFNLSREVESLRSDLRNMEHIENTLKMEIEELLDKRRHLEDINQNLKNQI